jgi:zinc and cadmium transporter
VQLYAAAIGLSVLGSFGGVLAASTFLLLGDSIRVKVIPWAISYAVGTLLGVAVLALLPQALERLPAPRALGTLLVGVLSFFLLEKLVVWRHCHDADECEVHTSTAASLVIVGDAFHTFVDGAVIAAAVLTSIPLGITTALAVATHEIPQEVGDVAILLAAGYSRTRALALNLVCGASGILGALLAYGAVELIPGIRPYVLAFSSASLLYIAMSDLIPDLHRREIDSNAIRQVALISAGIGTVMLFERLSGA